ncbi:hypothetical protein ACHAXR_004232 [Thalassiosira sp. AJA248-18]
MMPMESEESEGEEEILEEDPGVRLLPPLGLPDLPPPIEMAVVDAPPVDDTNIATKTEEEEATDEAGVVPTNEESANNEEEEAATTFVKKVVVLDAQHGNVIKTTETIIDPQHQPPQLPPPAKKAKKERKEFTAQQKIEILSELDGPTPPSVQSLLEKYGVSKSSLHRWRQPDKMERLQEMVGKGVGDNGEGGDNGGNILSNRDKLKKRDMYDKLRRIKLGLQSFCKENLARGENEQMAITSSLIALKAIQIKDKLLKSHEEEVKKEALWRLNRKDKEEEEEGSTTTTAPPTTDNILTDEEVAALKAFKGSKSWACLIGNQLGYLSSTPAIQWSDAAKANTSTYLSQHARHPPKPKKTRMEFTAHEKLMILRELEDTNAQIRVEGNAPPLTVDQICKKYHTSKSSLHRWKQQFRSGRLQELAEVGSGYCNAKRVFVDKLQVIKKELNDFVVENENAEVEKRVPVNYTTLQARAIMAKELILEQYHAAVVTAVHLKHEEQHDGEEEKKEGENQEGGEVEAPAAPTEDNSGSQEIHVPAEEGNEGQQEENDGADNGVSNSDDNNYTLTKEEVQALENFKASNSWLRETAKKYGWKLDMDKKEAASVMSGPLFMESIAVNSSVAAAAAAAAAVYHHPEQQQQHHHHHHHGVEQHPMDQHAVAEHHTLDQQHAMNQQQHAVEHHHHSVAVQDHTMAVVEQHGMAVVAESQQEHHNVVEGQEHLEQQQQQGHHHHQVVNETISEGHHHQPEVDHQLQHQQQQQQPPPQDVNDHLAPNMAVYDAQGNVMAEMLDPLVHDVEDHHVVDGMVDHGNDTTVDI